MTITEMIAKIQEEYQRLTGKELPYEDAKMALAHVLMGWKVGSAKQAVAYVVFTVEEDLITPTIEELQEQLKPGRAKK